MKVMVRMLTRGYPPSRSQDALEQFKKLRPEWDIDKHINHVAVDYARLAVTQEARKAKVDYLIMVDEDVPLCVAVKDMPQRMQEKDIDVLMGMVPTLREHRLWWNVYQLDDTDHMVPIRRWPKDECIKVYAAATGVCCISKRVLDARYLDPLWAFDYDLSGDNFKVQGEDITFSRKLRAHGIDTYVDTAVQCSHFKEVDLLGLMLQMMNFGDRYTYSFKLPKGREEAINDDGRLISGNTPTYSAGTPSWAKELA